MTRTCDMMVNSHPLYQLSYRGLGWASGAPTQIPVTHPRARVKSPSWRRWTAGRRAE